MILRLIRDLLVLAAFAFGAVGLEQPDTADARRTNILQGRHEYEGIEPAPHLRVLFWTTSTVLPLSPAVILLLSGSPMARWLATLALIAAVLWSYGTLRGRRRPGASRAAKPVQILYLRPFDTDEGVEYKTKRFGGIPVADPDAMRTFDEEICDAFHSFGRITALVPRNADPVPIGPDKVVFTPEGDDWHVFIETALGQARLVVLVLGRSASMLWELQTALRVVNRAQLLLVAPPGGIQTVWGQVSPVLTAAGWNIAPTPGCRLIVHGADGPHEFSGPTPYHDALGAVGRALTQGD